MTDTSRKCTICNLPVDLSNLHPASLPVPTDGAEWSAMHAGCAASEDAWNGANPSDEDLNDERAWIKWYQETGFRLVAPNVDLNDERAWIKWY